MFAVGVIRYGLLPYSGSHPVWFSGGGVSHTAPSEIVMLGVRVVSLVEPEGKNVRIGEGYTASWMFAVGVKERGSWGVCHTSIKCTSYIDKVIHAAMPRRRATK
jgi:Na+/pantothenate symporter